MSIHNLAGLVAGVIGLCAFVPGIIGIRRGEWPANMITFILWGIIDVILCFTSWAKEARAGVILIGVFALGDFVIAQQARQYVGNYIWKRSDKWAAALAILSIVLWVWYRSASLGLVFALVALFSGSYPQTKDLWIRKKEPEKSEKLTWLIFFLSSTVNLLTITDSRWVTWGSWLYAVSCAGANALFILLVFIPYRPKWSK